MWDFINLQAIVQIAQNAFGGRGSTITNVYFGGSAESFNSYVNDNDIGYFYHTEKEDLLKAIADEPIGI